MGLKVLSKAGLKPAFFRRLSVEEQKIWTPRVFAVVPSDKEREIYPMLGHVGRMREWLGNRQKISLRSEVYELPNRDWETGVGVPQNAFEDDQTGMIGIRMNELAITSAPLPDEVITEEIIEGNPDAYDGVALFADRSAVVTGGNFVNDRTSSTDSVLNVTTPAAPTSAEMSDAIFVGIKTLLSARNDRGGYMNKGARHFIVMVPLNMWQAALAAVAQQYISSGVSNALQTIAEKEGIRIEVLLNMNLTSTTRFYVFRADAGWSAAFWQERHGIRWGMKEAGSDHTYDTGELVFGVHSRGAPGVGEPAYGCRLTLS